MFTKIEKPLEFFISADDDRNPDRKPGQCVICGRPFKTVSAREAHMDDYHKQPSNNCH